jgi:hypothetical protein
MTLKHTGSIIVVVVIIIIIFSGSCDPIQGRKDLVCFVLGMYIHIYASDDFVWRKVSD